MSRRFDVEVLYAPTCPHVARTLEEVHAALREARVPTTDVDVRSVPCATLHEAREHGLAGSPTVRVNGVDVTQESNRPTLACRHYLDADHRVVPFTPAPLVRDALRHAHPSRYRFEREEDAELVGRHG